MKTALTQVALVVSIYCAISNIAVAMDSKKAIEDTGQLQQYYWYDGSQKIPIWLNPGLIAEIKPSPAGQAAVKKKLPGAMLHSKQPPSMRLWQIEAGVEPVSTTQSLNESHPEVRISPVLHDGPSGSSRMRALPGNIIIYMDPKWDEKTVNKWADSHNLTIVKKMGIGRNAYIIKTGPGIAALETANSIYESGEVLAAFPDWWHEVVKR